MLRPNKSPNLKQECIEILRGFMADMGDLNSGMRLDERREEIARLLENDMNAFTPKERREICGFMEGVFPKRFRRILAVRLREETDPECVTLLKAIADIHK